MVMRDPELSPVESEARLFGRYVLGREVNERTVLLYAQAVETKKFGDDDERDLRFVRRHPWALAAVDGARALAAPRCTLRARLILMAAVLETRPEYCDDFLPVERPPWYGAVMALTLVRAGLAALLGFALLPFVR